MLTARTHLRGKYSFKRKYTPIQANIYNENKIRTRAKIGNT